MAKGKLSAPLGKAERATHAQNDAQDTNNKPPPAQAPASSPGQAAAQTDTSSVATQRYRKIDPSRCRPWALHNRDAVWLTPENCADLIHSIRSEGQLDLGLVRKLADDPHHDFEIICGVRRWYSVSQLPETPFKARVLDVNDQECTVLMHVENEQSKDISAMEKGRSYRLMLEQSVYDNASSLARALSLSRSYVSLVTKAIEILDRPQLNALLGPHIREISYKDARELAVQIEDPRCRERVESMAVELHKTQIKDPKPIMRRLLSAAKAEEQRSAKPSSVVSLFKKGRKQYAYVQNRPNGAVTVTIEPGLKAAAGDDLEAVMKRIEKTLRGALG